MRSRPQFGIAITAIGVGLTISCAANANWYFDYTNGLNYTVGFTKVPDFDQRRSFFGNDGAMYCVPTSAINWMAYIAHHGYPTIAPADHSVYYWHSDAAYTESTNAIGLMAALMGTNASTGTTGSGAETGLDDWLPEGFVVTHQYIDGLFTPQFDDIADWIKSGVPVIGAVGWYSGTLPNITRSGGHLFSVVRVQRSGTDRWITIHDPGDDTSDLTTQSPVSEDTYVVNPYGALVQGQFRTMYKLEDYGTGYIDEIFAICPEYGLARSYDSLSLVLVKPLQLSFDTSPLYQFVGSPESQPILDVAHSPYSPHPFLTTAAQDLPSTLWSYDPVAGGYRNIMALTDGQQLVFGNNNCLYVLDGGVIRCLDVRPQFPVEIASLNLPTASAIAFNDVLNEFVVVDATDRRILRFTPELDNEFPSLDLPGPTALFGDVYLRASPEDGALFLASQGSDVITRMHPPDPIRQTVAFDLIPTGITSNLDALTVADGDRLIVTEGGTVRNTRMWEYNSSTELWEEQTSGPFVGLTGYPGMKLPYSRTNRPAAVDADPNYNNVLPPPDVLPVSSPPCLADLNDDFTVDGADLAILLATWGAAGDPDINFDGVVDGADLAAMLAAWGPCN